ncbi:MAG: SMC-Scp complex subunit ScpB, partial [Firmicutes bacterium]|nr:SMC-Scp complex subunit ScpB [Bacillota bacterium]
MELEDLDSVLESILFLSGSGVGVGELCEMLGVQKSEIKESTQRLEQKYDPKKGSGVILHKFNDKLQLLSNPQNKDVVESVLLPIKQRELTKATLETLAVVAYKQPITKLETEQVRGVNCDYAVQTLVKFDLVEVVGQKDTVGKPLLFGTTENFLKRFGLESLAELPDYEHILD